MHYATKAVASPLGSLTLAASDAGLAAILWENDRPDRVRLGAMTECVDHPVLRHAERELGDYFAGQRTRFSVPFDMQGTDFQKKVWASLLEIPFGETRSYGWIAARIGTPTASRAVGAANGRNPISIMVPCHRAIGADGSLTGFAGGLEAKRFLLALETQQACMAL
jgi:methylated-DNA-[protein]-cysteine S-methyltransferase